MLMHSKQKGLRMRMRIVFGGANFGTLLFKRITKFYSHILKYLACFEHIFINHRKICSYDFILVLFVYVQCNFFVSSWISNCKNVTLHVEHVRQILNCHARSAHLMMYYMLIWCELLAQEGNWQNNFMHLFLEFYNIYIYWHYLIMHFLFSLNY